jgi:hypothetical protein
MRSAVSSITTIPHDLTHSMVRCRVSAFSNCIHTFWSQVNLGMALAELRGLVPDWHVSLLPSQRLPFSNSVLKLLSSGAAVTCKQELGHCSAPPASRSVRWIP